MNCQQTLVSGYMNVSDQFTQSPIYTREPYTDLQRTVPLVFNILFSMLMLANSREPVFACGYMCGEPEPASSRQRGRASQVLQH